MTDADLMFLITSVGIEFGLRVPEMAVAELDERCLPAIARYRLLILEDAADRATEWCEKNIPWGRDDSALLRYEIAGGQT